MWHVRLISFFLHHHQHRTWFYNLPNVILIKEAYLCGRGSLVRPWNTLYFWKRNPMIAGHPFIFLLVHSCSDKWTLHVVLLNCRQFLEKMLIGAVIALEYHKLCIQILKIKIFMICNNVRQKKFIRWSEIIQHFILLEARQFKNNYHLWASLCKILMCHCMLWRIFFGNTCARAQK